MDIRQLRYFTAICRFRNLSHAAEHCHVASSALSHHIANLEAELGVQLFIRKARGMEPTAAGIQLRGHAEAILAAVEDAKSAVSTGHVEVSGPIAIGMPYSVIRVIGGAVMREVTEQMPRVRLLLREALSGVGYQALRAGEVEAALIFNPPADSETLRVPLLEEELFCIGAPEIVGDAATPIRLEEMAALPVALLQSGALSRALSDRPAELARLESGARIQLASIAGTLAAIEDRLACTLAPKALVAGALARGDLVARPVTEPHPVRTLHLVTPLDRPPTFLRERMMTLIEGHIRAAVDTGRWEGARLLGG